MGFAFAAVTNITIARVTYKRILRFSIYLSRDSAGIQNKDRSGCYAQFCMLPLLDQFISSNGSGVGLCGRTSVFDVNMILLNLSKLRVS